MVNFTEIQTCRSAKTISSANLAAFIKKLARSQYTPWIRLRLSEMAIWRRKRHNPTTVTTIKLFLRPELGSLLDRASCRPDANAAMIAANSRL